MKRTITATAMLVAILSVPFPLVAQQSIGHARAGVVTRTATVDLLQSTPRGLAFAAPAVPRQRGARLLHPKTFGSPSSAQIGRALAAGQSSQAQQAAQTLVDLEHSTSILNNFDGVSSLDSAVTNFGAEFEPPDQGLCVGNGFVVEPVNSAFTIYRENGTVVAGPFNVNKLFAEGFKQFTSDPRCYYDKETNTWFATILFINSANTGARTDIAVNNSGDPTTPWTVYHLDATDTGHNGTPNHPGCPCLGDQPTLGIDAVNLYITTNEFSILGTAFNGAQIYAISKSDLIANPTNVHVVHYTNLFIGGAQGASVQPALTFGPAGAEYFLSSLDPKGTGDQRVGVWALTNVAAVGSGGVPVLSRTVIGRETYFVPPPELQKGAQRTSV